MTRKKCDVPLESVCSRVAKYFFPISYVIKCALLSEVLCVIYVLAYPRPLGGVRFIHQIRLFFSSLPKRRES